MTVSDDSRQRGVAWLTSFLQLAHLPAQVSGYESAEPGEANCWLEIHVSDLTEAQRQALVGDRGQVLDAVQYLANSILNLGQAEANQQPYIVELDGYRVRRQAELAAIAIAVAEQVRTTGTEVEIPHLSAAERRQVHTILKDEVGLETFSRGKEPDRRLVVVQLGGAPTSAEG